MSVKEERKSKKSKIEIVDNEESKSKKKKKDKDKNKDKDDKDDKSEKSDGGKRKSRKGKSETDDESKKQKKGKTDEEKSEGNKKKDKKASFGPEINLDIELPKKVTEIERLRKSHYVREEKLKVLRAENAPQEEVYKEMFAEDYDDRIENIEEEIRVLKKTLEKRKSEKASQMQPETRLQMESDWLEVHIREWKFKIESLQSKFDLVKKAHENSVAALQQAKVQATDKEELEAMRQFLMNKKNDLYEATQLISELQKVAFMMLPPKVARHCEEVEAKMCAARKRLEDISYEVYKTKMEMASDRKEITALKTAIDGELELEKIMSKKMTQKEDELKGITKKKDTLEAIVTNGYGILEAAGINYEDAVAKAALLPAIDLAAEKAKEKPEKKKKPKKPKKVSLSDSDSKSIPDDGLPRKSVAVGMNEKISFLQNKLKDIESDLIITQKEMEKTSKEQQAVMAEMKKLTDLKNEIDRLTKTKENIGVQLQQEVVLRKTYYNQIEDLKGKIRVFSRCRPISNSELERGNVQCVSFPDKYTVAVHGVTKDGKAKEFQFDRVFPPETDQPEVFEDTARLIQSAFDGFNVCIFAYGQTGSGKTHTLIGNLQKSPGIAPRLFYRLFDVMNEGKTKFSAKLNCYMLELYNEKLLDLMAANGEYSDKLEIKKDQHGMVVVPGAELLPARTGDELRDLFLRGNGNRHIASTKMNSESSRSHLIISMMLECTQHSNGKIIRGKMSIIDLAGSERLAKSGVKGVGATEATAINMSLSALGDVISALTSGQPFVPYRNNKLTLLMQDSLGGNSKTLMFVNLSPVDYNATETVNSLVYAQRVKLIKNDATKVADTEEMPKLIAIIDRLQAGERIEDFTAT